VPAKKPRKSGRSKKNTSAPADVHERIDVLNDLVGDLLDYIKTEDDDNNSKEAYVKLLRLCQNTIDKIPQSDE
jgi:hypothetical protein